MNRLAFDRALQWQAICLHLFTFFFFSTIFKPFTLSVAPPFSFIFVLFIHLSFKSFFIYFSHSFSLSPISQDPSPPPPSSSFPLFLSSISRRSRLPAFLQLIPGQMGDDSSSPYGLWLKFQAARVPSRWDGALSHTAVWECCSSQELCDVPSLRTRCYLKEMLSVRPDR